MAGNMHIQLQLFAVLAGLAAAAYDDSEGQPQTAATGSDNNENNDQNGAAADTTPDIVSLIPLVVLLSLAGLAVLVAIYHLVSISKAYIRKLASLSNERQRSFIKQHPALAMLKEHLLYAPLLGTRHSNTEVKIAKKSVHVGMVPGRLSVVLLCGILAMNLILLLVDIPFSDAVQDPVGMLVTRSGTLAVVNLVPLILVSGRTNILIKLLGVSFDTFNVFHRWMARIVVGLAVTHALTNVIPWFQQGGFAYFQAQVQGNTHNITGLITVSAFIVLMLHSGSALRHAFYETFLHSHLLVVTVALVAVWYHLDGYPQQMWVVAAIASLIGEHATRMAILLYRNTGNGGTTALIEALPGDALRITLKMARSWTFRPGQHMYLYIPSVGLWTSHPFSVAWSEGQDNTFPDDKGLVMTRQDVLALQSGTTATTLSLVIRRRKGFTDHLYRRAANTTFGRISLMAFAEGPYGSLHSLDSYGTVLLIAGGIGITHQVPFARHLVAGFADGTVATRRLTLIWTVQSFDHLEWIRPWMKTIVDMPRCDEILRVRIFISRPQEGDEIPAIPQGSVVNMAAGRPYINELIDGEIRLQVGTMGVMVCGSGSLGDDVRRVCRKRQNWSHIDYMEESFTW